MKAHLRIAIWTFTVIALAAWWEPVCLNAARPAHAKHVSGRKHHNKAHAREKVIVLSNDDLPKNGQHYIMVPAPIPPVYNFAARPNVMPPVNTPPPPGTIPVTR